jgi:hypothetical protein
MNHLNSMLCLLPAALLLLGAAGCGDTDSATPTGAAGIAVDDYDAIDLNLAYGGLTATDEEPAFGDAYLVDLDAQDAAEEYEDELLGDPEVQALMAMGDAPGDTVDPERPRFTFLRLVWGALDQPDSSDGLPEDGEVLDWSGQVSVDRGIVLVRRVILFERPWDHILRPRPDRHTMAWISHTGGHVDGLVLQIIEPPLPEGEGSDGPPQPNMLHLRTAAYSADFPMDDISGMDEIIEVEPAGNGIHLAAFTMGDLDPCPRGFLAGQWCDDPDSDDLGGYFRGRWIDIFGIVRGYMLGQWGMNDDGVQVFAGKYTARDGAFLGLVAGGWAEGEQPGRGVFQGHWADEDRALEGFVDGRWALRPDRPCGLFVGRWATDCDDDAVAELIE